jgi:hypothetical protein
LQDWDENKYLLFQYRFKIFSKCLTESLCQKGEEIRNRANRIYFSGFYGIFAQIKRRVINRLTFLKRSMGEKKFLDQKNKEISKR